MKPGYKGLGNREVAQIRLDEPHCEGNIGIALIKGRFLSPAAMIQAIYR
ncbi:hypothetical protein FHS18_002209 [Paenibacillus phyllosphaerae]|uniref:Uncharacterized protein n=1 Tax=Paenibacillus phyllosphaerae TaxID=274593 RepID=A0A7W5FMJ3_9BACL|nr:hypothetical protein [Paenibacillus phyllosphaerae]MBB3110142.1 hypothetical protein [Paenibacillus phyllosphaerae]